MTAEFRSDPHAAHGPPGHGCGCRMCSAPMRDVDTVDAETAERLRTAYEERRNGEAILLREMFR